ncbi:MAG: YdhR family protein [Rhodovarius sp.]|nr:YdhR family protein [Rhodovarius sp.]
MDFPARPPGGEEQARALRALAESIAQEPGLIWKIWTRHEAEGRSGGIYLFESLPAAQAYHAMHAARLSAQGIGPIEATYRFVNGPLTAITRGPLPPSD